MIILYDYRLSDSFKIQTLFFPIFSKLFRILVNQLSDIGWWADSQSHWQLFDTSTWGVCLSLHVRAWGCVCVCVSVCQCATLSFIDLNSVRMAMLAAITLVSSVSLEDSYGAKKNSVSELTITMLQIMEETWLLRRRYVAICIRNIRISWKIRSWYCHALERWVNIIKHFQYHSCCFCQFPSLDCYVNKWSCQEWSW